MLTPPKHTVIRLRSQLGSVAETKIEWKDEDGPTYEQLVEVACAFICHHGIDTGDMLTVAEE